MATRYFLSLAATLAALALPAQAGTLSEMALVTGGGALSLPISLQCVPYAREVSGIQIRGDAWTWWGQAKGQYARGYRPKVGAVMAFKPYGRMELGHVAAVSEIIDSRTVLLRHANWSPINGTRGHIENDVRAVDVSPSNDWSQVRVWFAPLQDLGSTAWPVQGFIYNQKPKHHESLGRDGESGTLNPGVDRFANDPIGAIIAAASR